MSGLPLPPPEHRNYLLSEVIDEASLETLQQIGEIMMPHPTPHHEEHRKTLLQRYADRLIETINSDVELFLFYASLHKEFDMASRSDILAALVALGTSVSAAVSRIKAPPDNPGPIDTGETEFLNEVAGKLGDLKTSIDDALANRDPIPVDNNSVNTDEPILTGTASPGAIVANEVCPVCGRQWNPGRQSQKCPHPKLPGK